MVADLAAVTQANEAIPTGVLIGLLIMFSAIPLMFLVGVIEAFTGWYGDVSSGKYESWEHQSHSEVLDAMCRVARWARWKKRVWNLKYRFNLWRQMRVIQHEIDHEDPAGGTAEVLRLRQVTTVEPERLTQAS
jgi:hypothetical protein